MDWWSTRLFLAAALAADYTSVQRIVFVRDPDRHWVGVISPGEARYRLAQVFPAYDRIYLRVRADAAGSTGNDPRNLDSEVESILMHRWSQAFSPSENEVQQIATSDLLRKWLEPDLDTGSLPHGPLTPTLRYQVNARPYRYTALTSNDRLIDVVDRTELAIRTTGDVLYRQG